MGLLPVLYKILRKRINPTDSGERAAKLEEAVLRVEFGRFAAFLRVFACKSVYYGVFSAALGKPLRGFAEPSGQNKPRRLPAFLQDPGILFLAVGFCVQSR